MWKKILVGILVLIIAVISLVVYLTSGMTETAEKFFTQVRHERYDDAYRSLSEDFRRSVTKKQLIKFIHETGLDGYKSADWGNRSFEGRRGELEGTITTEGGGAIPLTIHFVKTEKGWQIYAIDKPAGGLKEKKVEDPSGQKDRVSQPAIPGLIEAKSMAKESMRLFALCVRDKSMKPMYSEIAQLWKRHMSLEEFNKDFAPFFEADIDLTVLEQLDPVVDPTPSVDKDGVMRISGYYDTRPVRVVYRFSYIPEKGEWKLFGVRVKLVKAPEK